MRKVSEASKEGGAFSNEKGVYEACCHSYIAGVIDRAAIDINAAA